VVGDGIEVPAEIDTFEAFRHWIRTDDYPENADVFWLAGNIWIDPHMEQIDSHNGVKTEIYRVLANLIKTEALGYFYTDRVRIAHQAAGLSNEPDALFISTAALKRKRIRRVQADDGGVLELEGSPDLVVENVSTSSVTKDYRVLRRLYWKAGVREYWIIDARKGPLRFEILRRASRGFVATREMAGWLRSTVLDCSFRLTVELDPLQVPTYTLHVAA
jgi:Uma2 family endonuclease